MVKTICNKCKRSYESTEQVVWIGLKGETLCNNCFIKKAEEIKKQKILNKRKKRK